MSFRYDILICNALIIDGARLGRVLRADATAERAAGG
jgi:hypothetical protein